MRCFLGWHHWGYFAVQTNLGSGNVVRVCERCKDLQNWMGITGRWSCTFDPSNSIAKEILSRAGITAPYAPVDIRDSEQPPT